MSVDMLQGLALTYARINSIQALLLRINDSQVVRTQFNNRIKEYLLHTHSIEDGQQNKFLNNSPKKFIYSQITCKLIKYRSEVHF